MILFTTNNNDIYNNPTLNGILTILENQKKESFLYCKKNEFKNTFKYNRLLEYDTIIIDPIDDNSLVLKRLFVYLKRAYFLFRLRSKITTIIGVDPPGLLMAQKIKSKYIKKAPIDYFSFEIFFKDEFPQKDLEIEICKSIRNLIIQDKLRESVLKKENLISSNIKTHLIPITPIFIRDYKSEVKTNFREANNIASNKKLIISFGTLAKWSGAEILLEILEKNKLPEDYILVLHSRFPLKVENNLHERFLNYASKNSNLILSTEYIDSFNDVLVFLQQFDFGVALYQPYNQIFFGDNLLNIGLASGKFSMYMKAQLPTFVSNLPAYNEYMKMYKFGFLISNASDFENFSISESEYQIMKQNCKEFYDTEIEAEQRIFNYLQSINELD